MPTLYFQSTAALSFVFLLASRVLLFGLLLHATRPKLPGLWSVLVTYIVGASAILLVDPADLLMGCALLVGLLAIASGEARTTWLSIVALGALAGVGFLLKFSVGLLSIWVALVVVASTPRWRIAAAAGAVIYLCLAFAHLGGDRQPAPRPVALPTYVE